MRPLRGIVYKVISVLVFIVMAAMIKATSAHVPPGQAVFFRSVFAIPVIVIWLIQRRELATGFSAANPSGHVWRGFVGTLAMGLGFAGSGIKAPYTFAPLPYPNHSAAWVLRDLPLRKEARAWLEGVKKTGSPRK